MPSITDFKAQLTGGGARANQFLVQMTFPSYVSLGILAGQTAQFLCKSAQLPSSNLDNVPINYRGRAVNFAGERTFEPWTVSIYNDTNFTIRNALESWSNGINNLGDNTGLVNPRDYQVDMFVNQLDRNGAIIKTYRFVDAYPSNISPIELDFDANNQIEIFSCTFTYNFWVATGVDGGSGSTGITINTPIGTFPL
jgi:hypothetical protein